MANTVKLGRVNMPRLLRQMRHRTSQVRDLVFVRDEVFQKDTKTTKSGGTLAGPAVNFGYETTGTATRDGDDANTSYHLNTPELVIPGLKCLQSPITSRAGNLERGGHRITGACTFYAPSLDYILALNNFSETQQFNELETYDKLIDIERVIVDLDAVGTTNNTLSYTDALGGSLTNVSSAIWSLSSSNISNAYEMDRVQFQIKSAATLNYIVMEPSGVSKELNWKGSLALSATEWTTIDVPIRAKIGDKTSIYKDGVRAEFTAGNNVSPANDDFTLDLDKVGNTHGTKLATLALIFSAGSQTFETRNAIFYKEAEWRIDAIKDYRDEYMAIGAVRIRGDRGSRRRTYG